MENKEGLYLDFLEIGSCDFNTLGTTITDEQHGMVIEPLLPYLSNIPSHKNLIKVNAAVLFDVGTIPIYFIKDETIKKYGLHEFMRGCNRVGAPHDIHLNYFDSIEDIGKWHNHKRDTRLKGSRDLVKEGLVSVKDVPTTTFKKLINDYNIKGIKFIKIDTEGLDCDLLHSYLDTIWNDTNFRLPEKIIFETNSHNDIKSIESIIARLKQIGYKLEVGSHTPGRWKEFRGIVGANCKATIKYKI